jgi:hypothetical protein
MRVSDMAARYLHVRNPIMSFKLRFAYGRNGVVVTHGLHGRIVKP